MKAVEPRSMVPPRDRACKRPGGGLFCDGGVQVSAINTIFRNDASSKGREVRPGSDGGASSAAFSYCDVEGGASSLFLEKGCTFSRGPGRMDRDPRFAAPREGDFHLRYSSPCRDRGNGNAPGLPAADFEGDPRTFPDRPDMGADEFHRHLYAAGGPAPEEGIRIRVADIPGTAPVVLWAGSGLLDPPIPTPYGDGYLLPPLVAQCFPGTVPGDGIPTLPVRLPSGLPSPCFLPIQALSGALLTNPSALSAP